MAFPFFFLFLRDNNKRYLYYFIAGSLQVRHEFKSNQKVFVFTNLSGAGLDQIRWEQVSRERKNKKETNEWEINEFNQLFPSENVNKIFF